MLDATASPACLLATALPVAFGGVALLGPCPVGSCRSCFQYVPMGAAMLTAAMLAAICVPVHGVSLNDHWLGERFGGFGVCCLRCDCSDCCDFTFGF